MQPEHAGRFEWERALRNAPDVTGTRLLVLLALATWMNADGTGARPSQAALAAAVGQGERSVRRHLAAAVEGGWLEVVSRGHRMGNGAAVASLYRATCPQPATPDLLSDGTTGHPEPVEDLNRTPQASQPDTPGTSTGSGEPPTKGDHVDQGEGALAIAQQIVTRHHDELPALLAKIERTHSPADLHATLHQWKTEGLRFSFPSELRSELLEALGPGTGSREAARKARQEIEATRALLDDRLGPPSGADCTACQGTGAYSDPNGRLFACDHKVPA